MPELGQTIGCPVGERPNIAEDVIYIVRGEDVRERGDKELRKGQPTPPPPR